MWEEDLHEWSDYSCDPSLWEPFIAALEARLREWGLQDRAACGEAIAARVDAPVRVSRVQCGSHDHYELALWRLARDGWQWADDLAHAPPAVHALHAAQPLLRWPAHRIARMFGVTEFLLLSPLSTSSEYFGTVEPHQARFLLSSACLALNHCTCAIPAFVPVHEPSRRAYLGRMVPGTAHGGAEVMFETDVTDSPPTAFSHLSGLIDLFRAKCPSRFHELSPLTMCVRHKWSVRGLPLRRVQALLPLRGLPPGRATLWHMLGQSALPVFIGPCARVLDRLVVSAAWQDFVEGVYTENAVFTSFKPPSATRWRLAASWLDERADPCAMAQLLHNLSCVLAAVRDVPDPAFAAGARELATWEAERRRQSAVPAARATAKLGSALRQWMQSPSTEATTFVQLSSPEQCMDLADSVLYGSVGEQEPAAGADAPIMSAARCECELREVAAGKCAPAGSLLSMLALQCAALANAAPVAMLWSRVVDVLRWHWDNAVLIPGLGTPVTCSGEPRQDPCAPPPPDMRSCLLYQKLQLLNVCIARRAYVRRQHEQPAVERRAAASGRGSAEMEVDEGGGWSDAELDLDGSDDGHSGSGGRDSDGAGGAGGAGDAGDADDAGDAGEPHAPARRTEPAVSSASEDDVDDEGGDSGFETASETGGEALGGAGDAAKQPSPATAPRAEPLRLLLTGAPLVVPVTQELGFMTEDELHEQQEAFLRLGDSPQAVRARQRVQSASLLSDMQAFKDANPGCVLEDFVRWHSPKDWRPHDPAVDGPPASPADAQRGVLSARMGVPTSVWQQTWRAAQPLPVARQPALFDASRAAQEVLRYLEELQLADLVAQLLAAALEVATQLLSDVAALWPDDARFAQLQRAAAVAVRDTMTASMDADRLHPRLSPSQLSRSIAAVRAAEAHFCRMLSVLAVLRTCRHAASTLAAGADHVVDARSAEALAFVELVTADAPELARLVSREYVIRQLQDARRDAPSQERHGLPARMYAKLGTEKFRVALACCRNGL